MSRGRTSDPTRDNIWEFSNEDVFDQSPGGRGPGGRDGRPDGQRAIQVGEVGAEAGPAQPVRRPDPAAAAAGQPANLPAAAPTVSTGGTDAAKTAGPAAGQSAAGFDQIVR